MLCSISRVLMSGLFATVLCHSAMADEVNCEQVAEETVLEMKAGAKDWWTEDIARMAGMAAASACFKTRSRLSAASTATSEPQTTGATAEFMGLQVKPLSGPPSRKPYERTDRD